jgi:catechol 2,3-dioxygenase-like lactoylglutathione lyase family enzyme
LDLEQRMSRIPNRRWLIAAATSLSLLSAWSIAWAQTQPAPTPAPAATPAPAVTPLISRIKIATVGAPDVAAIEKLYTEWLGLKVVEKGKVSPAMAKSWGAPKAAGKPFVLMSSASSPDVFIRAVQTDMVQGYKAMTTHGWNAIEILVEDPDKVYERLSKSPFVHVGGPKNLNPPFNSIRATQFKGPAEEILYFTAEQGDFAKSPLPPAKSFIDRPFIMVLAGPDANAMVKFYMDTFLMRGGPPNPTTIDIIAKAQGLPADHQFPLGLVRAAEKGNNIEIDGYPPSAKPRTRAEGQLPPGVAMTSFNVNSLDGLKVDFIAPPAKLYGDKRAATFIGPAGELTELIEEPRP